MEDMPIDIHVGKLMDWLVSRRLCERRWQDTALLVREKISHAIQDMPEHPDIVALLSGAHINYYHCLRIVDILKETEKDTKNLFGFYGSQRMKDWQEVVKLYANKNVGLAEASQMLARIISYEIPGLKKQIAKLEQTQSECDKREHELLRSSAAMRDQYSASCRQLGMEGHKLRSEIVQLLEELPQELKAIAEQAACLSDAVGYYREFVPFISPGVDPEQLVPTLHYLAVHGDVTTYEWRYGEAPLRVEPPPCVISEEEEVPDQSGGADDGGIDFGDSEIDFGDSEIDFGEDAAADIDWGGLEEEAADGGTALDAAALEAVGDAIADITVEDSGLEGGVARDSEALSLLDNPQTRAIITSELVELEAFLCQRVLEMTDRREEGMVATSQLQAAPQSVQLLTAEAAQQMQARVQVVRASLRAVKLQHLFLVKSSPRYVDRLAAQLRQKLDIAARMDQSAETMREKRRLCGEAAAALQPKLKLIIEKTRELQRQIEQSISEKYKGRTVNLLGGVSAA